jgi:hypothetical protein
VSRSSAKWWLLKILRNNVPYFEHLNPKRLTLVTRTPLFSHQKTMSHLPTILVPDAAGKLQNRPERRTAAADPSFLLPQRPFRIAIRHKKQIHRMLRTSRSKTGKRLRNPPNAAIANRLIQ